MPQRPRNATIAPFPIRQTLRHSCRRRDTLVSAEKQIAPGRKVLALLILDATSRVPPSGRNTPCHVEQHLLCGASHSGGEAEYSSAHAKRLARVPAFMQASLYVTGGNITQSHGRRQYPRARNNV